MATRRSRLAEAIDRPYESPDRLLPCGVSACCARATLHQAIPLLERGVALGQEADIPALLPPSLS